MGRLKDRYWFHVKDDVHEVVKRVLDGVKEDVSNRTEAYSMYLSLYQAEEVSLDSQTRDVQTVLKSIRELVGNKQFPMSLNVIKSCVDTLASKIASTKPRPQFLTNDGEWSLRQQAKLLEKFVEGVFYESGMYKEARRVFVDAAIFGMGFLKVIEEEGKVCVERVFPEEIIVDEDACLTSEPRSIFQRKLVAAELLIDKFEKHEAEIIDAMERTAGNTRYTESNEAISTDMVEVWEAWHRPSGKNAKDGRHVICIDGATLFDEKWKRDFPFLILRWTQKPYGWYGQGLCEELRNIQLEINKLITRIQQAMHYYAVTNTYVEKGSVNKRQLKNTSGNVIEVEPGVGRWPEASTPPPMASQVFEHLWQLYAKAFEIAGLSQLSATSRKPAGVESGVALRTLLDTETTRFGLVSRDWEEFFVATAREVVRLAKDIFERDGSFSTSYASKDFKEEIDFKEVNIDESAYMMKVYPTNFLPQSPSGKLAFVQEMMSVGLIDQRIALAMLDHPDVDRHMTLETAALNEIDRAIELILTKGRIVKPPPYLDKELAEARITKAALAAANAGAPPAKIEQLNMWLEMLLMPAVPPPPVQMEPPPPDMGPVPPGMPPGGPGAMPPSGMPIPGPMPGPVPPPPVMG